EREEIVVLFHRVFHVQTRWLDPLDELGIENDALGHVQKSLRGVRFVAFPVKPLAVRDTIFHTSLLQAIGLPPPRPTVRRGTLMGCATCIRTTSDSQSRNRCMPIRVYRRRSGPPRRRKKRPFPRNRLQFFASRRDAAERSGGCERSDQARVFAVAQTSVVRRERRRAPPHREIRPQ